MIGWYSSISQSQPSFLLKVFSQKSFSIRIRNPMLIKQTVNLSLPDVFSCSIPLPFFIHTSLSPIYFCQRLCRHHRLLCLLWRLYASEKIGNIALAKGSCQVLLAVCIEELLTMIKLCIHETNLTLKNWKCTGAHSGLWLLMPWC